MNERAGSYSAESHEVGSRVAAEPADEHNDDPEMDVLTIIAICAAVCLSMLIFACVACYRAARLRMSKKPEKDTIPVIILPDPFENRPMQRKLFREEAAEVESYKALDIVPQNTQIEIHNNNEIITPRRLMMSRAQSMSCLDELNIPENPFHRGNLAVPSQDDSSRPIYHRLRVPSFDDSDRIERNSRAACSAGLHKSPSFSMSRSTSSSDLSSVIGHDCETFVMFGLKYNDNKDVLTMQLHAIVGLPSKLEGSSIVVVTYLFPKETAGIQSKASAAYETVLLHETYTFWNVTSEELETCTLRINVVCQNKKKLVKSHMIGEACLKVSSIDWSQAQEPQFHLQLQTKRVKRRSTPEKYLAQSLGELFVLLQYQAVANRLKVLVRKATNLPKSDKIIGQPGIINRKSRRLYEQINLKCNAETITYRETKPQSGTAPVWNQPFLFDIPSDLVDSSTLEFVIMRGRRYTKDGVVGHVVIGPYGSRTGVNHWKDILKSWGLETARWHNVMPVFSYVDVPSRHPSAEWKELQDEYT